LRNTVCLKQYFAITEIHGGTSSYFGGYTNFEVYFNGLVTYKPVRSETDSQNLTEQNSSYQRHSTGKPSLFQNRIKTVLLMYFTEISVLQKSTLTKGAFSQKELSEKI